MGRFYTKNFDLAWLDYDLWPYDVTGGANSLAIKPPTSLAHQPLTWSRGFSGGLANETTSPHNFIYLIKLHWLWLMTTLLPQKTYRCAQTLRTNVNVVVVPLGIWNFAFCPLPKSSKWRPNEYGRTVACNSCTEISHMNIEGTVCLSMYAHGKYSGESKTFAAIASSNECFVS